MALTNHIVPDSPTNNFATWNPLDIAKRNATLSDGNLKTVDTTNNWSTRYLNLVPTNGIYYVEFYIEEVGTTSGMGIYVGNNRTWPELYNGTEGYPFDANTFGVSNNGSIYHNGSGVSYSSTYTTGDIVSFIIDYGSRNFWVRVNNNVLTGDDHTGNQSGGVAGAVSLSSGLPLGNMFVYTWQRGANNNTAKSQIYLNTGQDPTFGGNKSPTTTYTDANGIGAFYYQPPTDALALCTANLPEMTPTVNDDVPQDYFKAVIWKGDGNYPRSISTDFAPDLIWTKARTVTPSNNLNVDHLLMDSVRGDGNLKWISPSQTDAEGTYYGNANANLTSSGFTIQSTVGTNCLNDNNAKFAAWCFRAGGSPSATDDGTGVSGSAKLVDTSGAASSTTCKSFKDAAVTAGASNVICPSKMSINQAAGFSIVKYAGNSTEDTNFTIPHGLSEQPDFILFKNLDWATGNTELAWPVQMPKVPAYLPGMDGPRASDSWDYTYMYGASHADSHKVTVAASTDSTQSNRYRVWGNYNFIMYCWHSVENYSKCGSYIGNGSPDGPFVYCGFRPAFVMIKNIDIVSDWWLMDATRDPYNVAEKVLYPNLPDAEYVGASIFGRDFLSNGFKVRNNNANVNGNYTYIYMAFAEQPFKYANAR
jgi:hypothetical protein